MKVGQLWNQDKCKAGEINYEMQAVVPWIEAGQDEQEDRDDREELAGGRVLDSVVQLLPMCQAPIWALVKRDPRVGFHLE